MVVDTGFFAVIFFDENIISPQILASLESSIHIQIKQATVFIKVFPDAEIFQNPSNTITILTYGHFLNFASSGELVEQYRIKGESIFSSLNGSFALLLIDRLQNKVIIVTDRLSSKKIYSYNKNNALFLSTELKYLFDEDLSLDETGLAWYLSNGVFHQNRTVFREIRSYERAASYTYDLDYKKKIKSTYWHYNFTHEYESKNISDIKAELSELIRNCVESRIHQENPLYISLSAGFDASGILGVLNQFGISSRLCSFSYGMNETNKENDPYISKIMAQKCQINHNFLLTYDGNIVNSIERNAEFGNGTTHFCDESLIWQQLSQFIDHKRFPLMVGDECFGWTDSLLNDSRDILASCRIRDFSSLDWMNIYLQNGIYDNFLEGQSSDITDLLGSAPKTDDLDDIKDYIYFDQRLCHVILPWRQYYAGRIFSVYDPFLDNSIIDFMQKIPSKLRRDKMLYKETISEMLPEIFSITRAEVKDATPDWNKEVFRNKEVILDQYFINNKSSILDQYLNPDILKNILNDVTIPNTSNQISKSITNLIYSIIKNSLGTKSILVTRQLKPFKVTRSVFLIRVLILRRFLEIAKKESMISSQFI